MAGFLWKMSADTKSGHRRFPQLAIPGTGKFRGPTRNDGVVAEAMPGAAHPWDRRRLAGTDW
ncbi:MAG: hypothetical protein LGR52_15530 [Candidatus Thiosymbion ectosymbiont of Robbea hypermnestra]|nr:hypothetical protein [Candidatus Thiosymbion ectosymbiont of Robbea hypermnestra]